MEVGQDTRAFELALVSGIGARIPGVNSQPKGGDAAVTCGRE